MKSIALALLLLAPVVVTADEYEDGGWKALGDVPLGRSEVTLEVGSPEPNPVAESVSPPVTANRYLVAGEVRYTDASGFLEMWNHFGDQRYFTRTLGENGPMAKLEGSSDWRRFMLPFNSGKGDRPELLEINVVLPGGGSVELRGLKLYQTDAALPSVSGGVRGHERWGLVLAGAALAVTAIVWIGGVRRRRAERELRKMKAADLGS